MRNLVCTTCGCRLEYGENAKFGVCPACKNTYVVEIAEKLSKVEVDRTSELGNLRKLLAESVKNNDVKNISSYSNKILQIIPEDYSAGYYFAYAENCMGKNAYLKNFYITQPDLYTAEELNAVVDHIINNSDLRDRVAVEGYLMSLDGYDTVALVEGYKQCFNSRKRQEENYDDIPRDVFICHRSTNKDIAEKVVQALEKDGNKCWISYRNLRPNDSENYWDNIRKAITSCKVFLVISSEDAMLSNDVKNELNIAKSMSKPRVEYKTDFSEHTSMFKAFFDGLMWVEGYDVNAKSLLQLCQRVYAEIEKLHTAKPATNAIDEIRNLIQKQSTQTVQTVQVGDGGVSTQSLLKKARMQVQDGDFAGAEQTCERIADIDIESGEMWLIKLLCENKVKTLNELSNIMEPIDNNTNFLKAVKFSIGNAKQQLLDLQGKINNNIRRATEERRRAEEEQRKIAEATKRRANELIMRDFENGKSCAKYIDANGEVIIPNGTSKIGEKAFEDCKNLTHIAIPSSVTSIGSQAFEDCSGLTRVNISDIAAWCKISFDDNPLRYAKNLYLNGGLLTELVIPAGVTSIGDRAFCNCSGLESITIPSSVTSIGELAFYGCSGLTSITIPAGVTSIGDGAFYGCSGLTSITIPSSVTSIDWEAFSSFTKNQTISIDKSKKEVKEQWGKDWCKDCKAKIVYLR